MQVVICADASPAIGVGHFMRCLALAQSFDDLGVDCFFLGEINEIGWVKNLLNANTFLKQIKNSNELSANKRTVLVLDTYSRVLGESILYKFPGVFTCAIVDNVTPDFGTNISLHLGPISENDSEYKKFVNLSSGVSLIPIRHEIKKVSYAVKKNASQIDMAILLTLGGANLAISHQITSYLKGTSNNLQVMDYTSVNEEAQKNSIDYPNFLTLSDYVISGGGYSMWESIYLNKHLAVIELAHNQRDNVLFAKEHQLAHIIGQVDQTNYELVLDEVEIQKYLIQSSLDTEKHHVFAGLPLLGGNSAAELIMNYL
jgi:spore coat polysaccharide biosynthesis predicted glycosyltransferase SpsG